MTASQTDPPPAAARAARGSARRAAVTILVVIVAGAAVFALNRFVTLDLVLARYDALRTAVDHNRPLGLGLFMLAYAGAVAVSLPGASLFTLLGGLLFGWLAGGLATVAAATTGAVLLFLIARTALGPLLAGRAGPRLQRVLDALRADLASYLLFLRLAPVFPFWLVNLAAALLPAPLGTFALTTAVGILPGSFAMASAGAALAGVVEKRKVVYDACVAAGRHPCSFEITLKHVLTPEILLSLGALGLLALVPVALRRLGLMKQWRSGPPSGDAA
ncbi:VTT domain-containing protein [uncultured Alsobacter sp.]|uniref:VTT domain-containing protein n=1 Tax=uncultured Alsobacter sp. TaxID=1748258 RepID=UPI0025EE4A51|nr:VTT domain-containing protein [uncultured Alsobacter sp.]